MSTSDVATEIQAITISREIFIAAPIEVAFGAMLEEIGPGGENEDGSPFPMVVEPRPGGRWFRDLGGDAGHLWGHVQVIKPPTLLEISGPMFMSFPAVNHVQYRFKAEGPGTRLIFCHRGMGTIPEQVREGVNRGWDFRLNRIAELAGRRASKP